MQKCHESPIMRCNLSAYIVNYILATPASVKFVLCAYTNYILLNIHLIYNIQIDKGNQSLLYNAHLKKHSIVWKVPLEGTVSLKVCTPL